MQRMLVRGETAIASIGIALAAILLGTMAAAGWWTLRLQQEVARSARTAQVTSVAGLLAQSAEPLLANNELTAVRRLVAEAGRSHELSVCRIVLPGGHLIADAEVRRVRPDPLPATWPQGKLPGAPAASPGALAIQLPLNVPGRGPAQLQVVAATTEPLWSFWETQTGLGTIGAAAMISLLIVYRRMRSKLRAVGAVREALLASQDKAVPAAALFVSPSLGPEAEAWNVLVNEADRARKTEAAEKVRETLGRRRQARGDLDAACDAMSHGLLLVDEQSRVKYANGAAAAFLRVERDKLVGTEAGKFLQVPAVLDAIREVAGGSPKRAVIDVQRKDDDAPQPPAGRVAGPGEAAGVLRFSVRPVRREDTERFACSAMVVIEDVTQQKAAEEARHSFVAQATHELRTPLTNIRLYVETAIEDGEQDPAVRAKCLNVINGEARRLERIVGEMLSVAEIEAGSFKLKSDDVRLDALFDEMKADFAEQSKDKQIALTFVLPPKLPVIQGDRDKVVLALHNLIGNALKYTPSGGAVAVSVEADDKRVNVSVRDTGFGIAPDDQERIFERFYRANDSRVAKITGTGLGLTLAREVVRLHGGDITVESALNQGSTFTMILPAKPQAA